MVTRKTIKIPIYDFTIHLFIFDNWDEISKYHVGAVEDEREGFLLTNSLYPTTLKFFVNSSCPSCIVHEIIHIKNIIFDIIHHVSNSENDEPEAYLAQYLYKKIVDVYYKHKDNAKK